MKQSTLLKVAVAAVSAVATLGVHAADDDAEARKKIEIVQYVAHPSLDAANRGFLEGLAENGFPEDRLEVRQHNAQGESANNAQIAGSLARSDADLIFAIATPSAQAISQAVDDIPVLFSAVTDPESAKLVDSLEHPGGNVTGTTDANPITAQLELLKTISPDAETVGIVYSSGETNSQTQVEWAKEAAEDLGLEIKTKGVSRSSEVSQAANALNVDAIYVPTDNMVVAALESLLKVAFSRNIPVIAAEGDSVERGSLATVGISYEKLGKQTGAMAAKILKGEAEPADMPVEAQSEYDIYLNQKTADRIGIEFPEELKEKALKIFE